MKSQVGLGRDSTCIGSAPNTVAAAILDWAVFRLKFQSFSRVGVPVNFDLLVPTLWILVRYIWKKSKKAQLAGAFCQRSDGSWHRLGGHHGQDSVCHQGWRGHLPHPGAGIGLAEELGDTLVFLCVVDLRFLDNAAVSIVVDEKTR